MDGDTTQPRQARRLFASSPPQCRCDDGRVADLLRPLVAYIPTSKFGRRVVGPPSATITEEQREAALDDPLSFRHSAGRKAGSTAEVAAKWISDRVDEGALFETDPAVLVYRQEKGDFAAKGIVADMSLEAYRSGSVKRHEKTIAKTQRKMAEYMRTTRVFGNPPVAAFPPTAGVDGAIGELTGGQPDSTFATVDDITHQIWLVTGDAAQELCRQIDTELYITDGHHRLAAAALVASEEGRLDARMPVGVFSANEFRLRSFARCVTDPELDADTAVAKMSAELELEDVSRREALPRNRFEIGSRIGDQYLRIQIPDERIPKDTYGSLNTNLIQHLILGPIFGITNPRLDKRLRFVAHLDDRAEPCPEADAWLLPFPLEVSDVMTVANSNRTMPAKSTWFAPKLPSGLVIRPLDQP